MNGQILRDAHAVLLPATARLDLEAQFASFLTAGGRAVLLGEDRDEYVRRRMSDRRLASETPEDFTGPIDRLRARFGPFIVAVDHELGGIQRLEGFTPGLPSAAAAALLPDKAVADAAYAVGRRARELGITMVLAPIADVVTGFNPWLDRRTLGDRVDVVTRLATAFMIGLLRAGIVPVAKHFPGYARLDADPALEPVTLDVGEAELWAKAAPFAALIAAGIPAVMTGPAPVAVLDPDRSASLSPTVMHALRQRFGFTGLIITDDLDAPATLRDMTLSAAVILALRAGADLLLLANGPHLGAVCRDIAVAAAADDQLRHRLADAAASVRSLAGAEPEPLT